MIYRILFAMSLTYLSFACQQQSGAQTRNVDALMFKKQIESNKESIIIDVRTPEEYNLGHLPNAINIDYYGNTIEQQFAQLPKNKTLLIYCRSGGRSAKSCSMLENMGYQNVYNLEGGIGAWSNAGYAVNTDLPNSIQKTSSLRAEDLYKKPGNQIWVFSAKWCLPCKKMAPELDELQIERKDWKFNRLDADENKDLLESLGSQTVPFVLAVQNGKKLWQHEGYISKQSINQKLP